MDQEIKAEWVETLRSGEFQQAQKRLHLIDKSGNHSYCCLGILCEIAVKRGLGLRIDIRPSTVKPDDSFDAVSYDRDIGVLPERVVEWSGLDDRIGMINDDNSLASMNDQGKTFDEIADVIEREF